MEIRYSTELPGLWRIYALGGLVSQMTAANDPFTRIFFRRFRDQAGHPFPASMKLDDSLEYRDVPLGETLSMWTGACLRDNAVIEDMAPDLTAFDIDLTFELEKQNIVAQSDLVDTEGHPLFQNQLHSSDRKRLEQILFLRHASDDGRYKIIVPCQELFRFYYLTSSRLGRLITSTEILDPTKSLFSETGTQGPNENGEMQLVLRRGVLESDAPIAARWLTKDRYGLHRAQDIARHLINKKRIGDTITMRVKPPFEGKTTWRVLGRTFKRCDVSYLWVLKIQSCSASFNYSSLRWRFDSADGPAEIGSGSENRPTSAPRVLKEAPMPEEFIALKSDNQPSSSFIASVLRVDDLASRFPSLNLDAVVRERRARKDTHHGARQKTRVLESIAETDSGRKSSSRGAAGSRGLDITVARPFSKDDKVPAVPNEDDGVAVLKSILGLCDHLETMGYSREDRVDNRESFEIYGRRFSYLPDKIDRAKRRFVFLDREGTHRRPIYVCEFFDGSTYGYLFEAVRGYGQRYCTLLVWAKDNSRINADSIAMILAAFSQAGLLKLSATTLKSLGIDTHRFLHRMDKSIEERADEVIFELGLRDVETSQV